jgi:pimeloyl-ACP methyl ester carboxylesterase
MLHATIAGSGPTLVLLHGFCETNTCFNKQVLLLNKQGIRTVCIDLPGFGTSSHIICSSVDEMAEAVHKTLFNLNIHSCVMLGHSMGGYVSLAVAKKFPELLCGIGLLHSTALPDSAERKGKRDQAIAFIKTHGIDVFVSNFIPPLFAPEFADKQAVDLAISQAKHTSVDGLCGALEAMKKRDDSSVFVAETDLPILYIAGAHDNLIPENDILKQAATLKNGDYYLLRNSGHMGMIEEPDTCADYIARFVKSCFSSSYIV